MSIKETRGAQRKIIEQTFYSFIRFGKQMLVRRPLVLIKLWVYIHIHYIQSIILV